MSWWMESRICWLAIGLMVVPTSLPGPAPIATAPLNVLTNPMPSDGQPHLSAGPFAAVR